MLSSNPFGRLTYVVVALVISFSLVLIARGTTGVPTFHIPESIWHPTWSQNATDIIPDSNNITDISYDLTTVPSVGCEDIVNDLQQRLIQAYSKRLKGIRYANIWGYLETENKGDAAIWSAQQMLLATLGIETMEACRFMHKGCDVEKFTARLEEHRPHSGIIMAGGGNFNDYYWEDQPSRMKMIRTYTNTSVRAFPQSIYMVKENRIESTRKSFIMHHDLQLAARDKPSHDWLVEQFGDVEGIETDLIPDIAFMWGNRSDFRTNTEKKWDLLILARKDGEVAEGDSEAIPFGTGYLNLGAIGNITYNKVDWKFTDTPGINGPEGSEGAETAQNEFNKNKDKESNKDKEASTTSKASDDNAASATTGASNDDKASATTGASNDNKASETTAASGTTEASKPSETTESSKPSETTASSNNKRDDKEPEVEEQRENGVNQRAWAKAVSGFELLGSARFVITDRLHGHIMSTVIGTPHVLMDSKLGKNLNFHNTWTRDCKCTRITDNIADALDVASRWFAENDAEGGEELY